MHGYNACMITVHVSLRACTTLHYVETGENIQEKDKQGIRGTGLYDGDSQCMTRMH